MAKIKHPSVTSILNETIQYGRDQMAMHLFGTQKQTGREIDIDGKSYRNFGTCGYLGLEFHPQVKQAAITAIEQEGLHVSASRAYLSSANYKQLSTLLSQVFEAPVLITPTTTLGHLAALPVLVKSDDLVILDQHVHASVSQAVQVARVKGTIVKTVRHNNLEMLEYHIEKQYDKYRRIWYMFDGLFSMHGDFPDMDALVKLLEKYPKLWLYGDDAHGLSWAGKHGRGYVLSKVDLHPRMIMSTSMKKGFGSGGGIIVFPDEQTRELVKNCGSSILFSGPLNSASLGAGIASAKIHLSDEIYALQSRMNENVAYCNQLMKEADLPLLSFNESPIFFLSTGVVKAAYNMQQRLMKDGIFTNSGIFPAVPLKCSGIRFTVCAFHTKEDIEALVATFAKQYPLLMEEEGFTMEELARVFNKPHFADLIPGKQEAVVRKLQPSSSLSLQYETQIKDVDKDIWNRLLGANGSFDYEGVAFLEQTFTGHEDEENNWRFHYYIIRDEHQHIIAATFFTEAILKDDMFSPPSVSLEVEKERKENPSYFTSRALMMGSPITEGEHLHLDQSHPQWKNALKLLLDDVWKKQEACGATQVLIRDISPDETALHEFLFERDFIKINLPDANLLTFPDNKHELAFQDYLESLSKNRRVHLHRYVKRHEASYEIRTINEATEAELHHLYQLYCNVKDKNLSINVFDLPIDFFRNAISSPHWEVLTLHLRADMVEDAPKEPIGFVVMYTPKDSPTLSPMVAGLNYTYLKSYGLYRQLLYQVVKYAWEQDRNCIYLGLSANIEKGKLGAIPHPKVAYMYTTDEFSFGVLNNMSVTKLKRHY